MYNRIAPKKGGWAREASNEAPDESVTELFASARMRLLSTKALATSRAVMDSAWLDIGTNTTNLETRSVHTSKEL